MRLGTETGSLINHVSASAVTGAPDPKVGDGATELMWSDRKAATVIRVFQIGKLLAVEVQRDKATRTDANGMSDCQSYAYTPNPEGARSVYRRDADGRYREVAQNPQTKRWSKVGGYLRMGVRDSHFDYSF